MSPCVWRSAHGPAIIRHCNRARFAFTTALEIPRNSRRHAAVRTMSRILMHSSNAPFRCRPSAFAHAMHHNSTLCCSYANDIAIAKCTASSDTQYAQQNAPAARPRARTSLAIHSRRSSTRRSGASPSCARTLRWRVAPHAATLPTPHLPLLPRWSLEQAPRRRGAAHAPAPRRRLASVLGERGSGSVHTSSTYVRIVCACERWLVEKRHLHTLTHPLEGARTPPADGAGAYCVLVGSCLYQPAITPI